MDDRVAGIQFAAGARDFCPQREDRLEDPSCGYQGLFPHGNAAGA
jgi:hypothetical protein